MAKCISKNLLRRPNHPKIGTKTGHILCQTTYVLYICLFEIYIVVSMHGMRVIEWKIGREQPKWPSKIQLSHYLECKEEGTTYHNCIQYQCLYIKQHTFHYKSRLCHVVKVLFRPFWCFPFWTRIHTVRMYIMVAMPDNEMRASYGHGLEFVELSH